MNGTFSRFDIRESGAIQPNSVYPPYRFPSTTFVMWPCSSDGKSDSPISSRSPVRVWPGPLFYPLSGTNRQRQLPKSQPGGKGVSHEQHLPLHHGGYPVRGHGNRPHLDIIPGPRETGGHSFCLDELLVCPCCFPQLFHRLTQFFT